MGRSLEKLHKEIVESLKRERKAQGLSHEKLAQKAGVTRPTISYIESGKIQPTLSVCLKVCKALGVSLGEIITNAEQTP
jgi:putative transcriptional regulator